MPPRFFSVPYADPEVETAAFAPRSALPPLETVPQCCDELFEVTRHRSILWGVTTKSVRERVSQAETQKNQGAGLTGPLGAERR